MLDLVSGAGQPITLGGKQFLVGALKLREEGFLVGYLRTVVKKPLTALREVLDLIPESERRTALKEATYEENNAWLPEPSSPQGEPSDKPEGGGEVVRLDRFRKK